MLMVPFYARLPLKRNQPKLNFVFEFRTWYHPIFAQLSSSSWSSRLSSSIAGGTAQPATYFAIVHLSFPKNSWICQVKGFSKSFQCKIFVNPRVLGGQNLAPVDKWLVPLLSHSYTDWCRNLSYRTLSIDYE